MEHLEFRKDLVSGDWILVAGGRIKRPDLFVRPKAGNKENTKKVCPFDNPQKNGGPLPIAWYPKSSGVSQKNTGIASWFVQVIPNKYPIVAPHDESSCPVAQKDGPYENITGVGEHEVIITRSHRRSLGQMTAEEAATILLAYQDRYRALRAEPCVKYVLVFHNHGEMAGASIPHPHSQLIALPIVPPDVARSFEGSRAFFQRRRRCVHCVMLEWERGQKRRVLFENASFTALLPYASRVSFEIRIFPKRHEAHFEQIGANDRLLLGEALINTLSTLRRALGNPDYNFFIHTGSPRTESSDHYHWHIEILPRTSRWAGLELGTGIVVVAVPPEEAAQLLRKRLVR